jgi:hypothetical protein
VALSIQLRNNPTAAALHSIQRVPHERVVNVRGFELLPAQQIRALGNQHGKIRRAPRGCRSPTTCFSFSAHRFDVGEIFHNQSVRAVFIITA